MDILLTLWIFQTFSNVGTSKNKLLLIPISYFGVNSKTKLVSRPPSDSVVQAYGKLFQHMARFEPEYNYHGDNHMFCPDKKYNWLFT